MRGSQRCRRHGCGVKGAARTGDTVAAKDEAQSACTCGCERAMRKRQHLVVCVDRWAHGDGGGDGDGDGDVYVGRRMSRLLAANK